MQAYFYGMLSRVEKLLGLELAGATILFLKCEG